MEDEFRQLAGLRGVPAQIETICVEGAMPALRAGDGAAHDRLLAEAAPRLAQCDAVLLAHFSTARAEAAVRGRAVLPGADRAGRRGRRLKSRVG